MFLTALKITGIASTLLDVHPASDSVIEEGLTTEYNIFRNSKVIPASQLKIKEIKLGTGLFSEVYLCEYRDRKAAIKIFKKLTDVRKALLDRYKDFSIGNIDQAEKLSFSLNFLPLLWEDERHLLADLKHSNIVDLLGCTFIVPDNPVSINGPIVPEVPALVYEYCTSTLENKVVVEVPLEEFITIAHQLASAINYMQVDHAKDYYDNVEKKKQVQNYEASDCGICHLDLKPSNIMNCPKEEDGVEKWKIVDFGMAKRHCRKHEIYYPDTASSAPEIAKAYRSNSFFDGYKADVYSLGAVFMKIKESHKTEISTTQTRAQRLKEIRDIKSNYEDRLKYRFREGVNLDLQQLENACDKALDDLCDLAQIHLIMKMMEDDPLERYTITMVLEHPVFHNIGFNTA
eukprot:NODE_324_length_10963_cov_0.175350.p4 type:complete len:402 gc:universal NODE_324_length_10963_cov_0.175350:2135-930(-)